jgi:hypothetical protein
MRSIVVAGNDLTGWRTDEPCGCSAVSMNAIATAWKLTLCVEHADEHAQRRENNAMRRDAKRSRKRRRKQRRR